MNAELLLPFGLGIAASLVLLMATFLVFHREDAQERLAAELPPPRLVAMPAPTGESVVTRYDDPRTREMVVEIRIPERALIDVQPHALENMVMDLQDYFAAHQIFLHNVPR